MRILSALDAVLQAQRGYLFPWVPVFFGLGICLYFLLPDEPDAGHYGLCALVGLLAAYFARRVDGFGILALTVLMTALGFLHMGARTHWLAAPVLEFRYYGPVEGQVVGVDRSASDAPRIILRHVRLDRMTPERIPYQVRLSLFAGDAPPPGAWVMTTAHLSPPEGPVEPGGFDFRRHAWFLQLGAVGYARVPVLQSAPPATLPIASLRARVSDYVRAALPERTGGVAAALVTGDRAHVSQQVTEALRASNLAHLLAISGLHMGLFAGLVFAGLRRGFALCPPIALRWPVKKISAGLALVAGFGYLLLSGANVATERAFLMVAVMLVAVMLDRRALSVRAVALAAMLVLLRRPESLLGPGFQMSFAATLALVAVFQCVRPFGATKAAWTSSALRWGSGVFLSSLVAGLATAPISAAHFNMMSHYGLIANLVAVPVMGAVVVPGALLAFCLAPLGVSGPGFWIMGQGIAWILTVAETVASWPGARGYVMAPDPHVLPLIVTGGLVLCLWQGRLRWLGALPVALGLLLWPGSERPAVLIAEDGGLVGVMTDQGRALSRSKGKSFVAGIWLENDGDGGSQEEAFGRWNGTPDAKVQHFESEGRRYVHVIGKAGRDQFLASTLACAPDLVVIFSVPLDEGQGPKGSCKVLTPSELTQSGSLALDAAGRITATRDPLHLRLWSGTN